jgi:hypothetical protein
MMSDGSRLRSSSTSSLESEYCIVPELYRLLTR